MFDTVEKIYRALGIESTWLFVLIIALIAAIGGGGIAWIVDRAYKRSPEYKAEHTDPKQQTVAASNSASQSATVQNAPTQGVPQSATAAPPPAPPKKATKPRVKPIPKQAPTEQNSPQLVDEPTKSRHPNEEEKTILTPLIQKCVQAFPNDKDGQEKCLNDELRTLGRNVTLTLSHPLPPSFSRIHITGSQGDIIEGNTFWDTGRTDIELTNTKNETIRSNEFKGEPTTKTESKKPN